MTTRLLIVRHGESTWNAAGRWQGRSDPPLSEHGEQQSQHAAQSLTEHGRFDIVLTSPLRRARRTGMLLARGASIRLGAQIDGLSERAAGAWEGLTREQIDARYPGDVVAGRWPDGFEPDTAVIDRASSAIEGIVREYQGATIVVVTHGGVMETLERCALVNASEKDLRFDHLEGVWLRTDSRGLASDIGRIRLVPPADRRDRPTVHRDRYI